MTTRRVILSAALAALTLSVGAVVSPSPDSAEAGWQVRDHRGQGGPGPRGPRPGHRGDPTHANGGVVVTPRTAGPRRY
jgi:hypothetical protein